MKNSYKPMQSYRPLMIALVFFTVSSCQNPSGPEIEPLREQRDSLLEVAAGKDTIIHQLTTAFGEIETNLAEITKRQSGLMVHAAQKGDMVVDKREEINRNIREINNLMISNSEKIMALDRQLKQIKYHNVALSRMVTILFEHIMFKNNDLADLNLKLRQRNKSILALNSLTLSLNEYAKEKEEKIEKQEQELALKEGQLNTAYYLLGDNKALKQMCVLDSKEKLMGGFNQSYFKRVNISEASFIPGDRQAGAEIVKLLTPHPVSSYELVKNDQGKAVNIKIKNRGDFWSRSKYLVAETR